MRHRDTHAGRTGRPQKERNIVLRRCYDLFRSGSLTDPLVPYARRIRNKDGPEIGCCRIEPQSSIELRRKMMSQNQFGQNSSENMIVVITRLIDVDGDRNRANLYDRKKRGYELD